MTGACPSAFFQIQTDKKEYGPFCGTTLPRRIETKNNSVTITFITDQSGDHAGWQIHYTSTGEGMWVSDPGRKLGAPVSCRRVNELRAMWDGTLPGQAGDR